MTRLLALALLMFCPAFALSDVVDLYANHVLSKLGLAIMDCPSNPVDESKLCFEIGYNDPNLLTQLWDLNSRFSDVIPAGAWRKEPDGTYHRQYLVAKRSVSVFIGPNLGIIYDNSVVTKAVAPPPVVKNKTTPSAAGPALGIAYIKLSEFAAKFGGRIDQGQEVKDVYQIVVGETTFGIIANTNSLIKSDLGEVEMPGKAVYVDGSLMIPARALEAIGCRIIAVNPKSQTLDVEWGQAVTLSYRIW